MAYSDGALIVDTSVNNSGVFKGAREFKRACESMKTAAVNVGKVMGKAGDAYLRSVSKQGQATRDVNKQLDTMRQRYVDIVREMNRIANTEGKTDRFYKLSEEAKALSAEMQKLRGAKQDLGGVEQGFEGVAQSAGRARQTIVGMIAGGAWGFLKKLAAGARNAAIALAKLAGRAVVSGLKKIGQYAGQAAKKLFHLGKGARQSGGGFQMSLKNLLRYGLGIRSLFVLFNKLRAAIKEGFGELSKQNPRLRAALGSLSASLNSLKGSLASAFAPILTAIAPALNTFINLLTKAINTIGMFFAAMTGQAFYAAQGISSIGDAANSASGSAKDLKRQLAGFDELNVLSANSSGSSGSSAGYTYQQTPISSGISDFVQQIKDLFAKGEFEQVGQVIADGINGALDKVSDWISWDNIGPTITKVLTAVTDGINGFFGRFDWSNLGTTIGEGLNTVINTLRLWFNGINWEQIGRGIGDALNNLIKKVDWKALGKLVSEKAGSLISVLKGAVTTIEWGDAGEKLSNALNGFFSNRNLWKDIGDTIDTMLQGVLDLTKRFLVTFDEIEAAKRIRDALGRIDWPTIASKFWETAKTAFQKAGNFLKVLLGGDLYDVNGDAVEQLWDRWNGASSQSYGENAISTLVKKVEELLGKIDWKKVLETVWNGIVDAVKWLVNGLFGNNDAKVIVLIGSAILAIQLALKAFVGTLTTTAAGYVGTFGADIAAAFAAAAKTIAAAALLAFDAAMIVYDVDTIKKAAQGYAEAGKAYENSISTALDNYKKLYDTKGKEVADAWARDVYGIDLTNTSFEQSQQLLADHVGEMWGDAPRSWWEALQQGWNKYFGKEGAGLTGLVSDAISQIGEFFGVTIPEGAQAWMTGAFTGIFPGASPFNAGSLFDFNAEAARYFKIFADEEIGDRLDNVSDALEENTKAAKDNTKEIKNATTRDTFSGLASSIVGSLPIDQIKVEADKKRDQFLAEWGDAMVDIGVNFEPNGPGAVGYMNNLAGYLAAVFKPGTDTTARVGLEKSKWTTLQAYANANRGGDATEGVGLVKSGWQTLAAFVGTNSTLSALVGLAKSGWSTLGAFVGTKNANGTNNPLSVLTKLIKDGWTSIAEFTGDEVSVWTQLKKWGWDTIAKFVGDKTSVYTALLKSGWTNINQYITGNNSGTVNLTLHLNPDKQTAELLGLNKGVTYNGGGMAKGGYITAAGRLMGFAGGGFISGSGVRGFWNSIPHYAHGTLFAAGEAGPEVVGHIGGRTEVLNKSQLAQTMQAATYNGMIAALSRVTFRMPAMAGSVLPYDVSAQIAKTGEDIQRTLDANNEDLIQTIISVAAQIVTAVNNRPAPQPTGGTDAQAIINEINRRTRMFGASPIVGV